MGILKIMEVRARLCGSCRVAWYARRTQPALSKEGEGGAVPWCHGCPGGPLHYGWLEPLTVTRHGRCAIVVIVPDEQGIGGFRADVHVQAFYELGGVHRDPQTPRVGCHRLRCPGVGGGSMTLLPLWCLEFGIRQLEGAPGSCQPPRWAARR